MMNRIRRVAQKAHERRQALDVLAMDLDQFQAPGDLALSVDRGVRSLDQRRLAHAARAPEQRIVGGKGAREALGVLDQKVAHPVDPAQERDIDAVDVRNRREGARVGAPDEGLGRVEIGFVRGSGREAIERLGDAAEEVGLALERRQGMIQFEGEAPWLCHKEGPSSRVACRRAEFWRRRLGSLRGRSLWRAFPAARPARSS